MPVGRRNRRRPRRRRRKPRRDIDYQQLALIEDVNVDDLGNLSIAIHPRSLSRFYYENTGPNIGLLNYAKFKDIYDEWRSYFVVIEYTSLMNTSYLASSGSAGATLMPQAVLVFDPDNTVMADVNIMLAHKGSQLVSLNENWKRTFKIPRYTNPDATSPGWANLQTEQANNYQQGGIFLQTLTPMTPPNSEQAVGIIKIKVYAQFKGRNDSNVSAYYGVGATGAVMTSPPNFPQTTNMDDDGLHDDQQYFIQL